ncbi:MAG: 2-alkenal reductase [uncultured bacterium]|nr:MAG: 2-alkenal reductase [uncultured bacterium]HCS41117.1 trypsin [Anaerolineaceae bacterium]
MKKLTTIVISILFLLGLMACQFSPNIDFFDKKTTQPASVVVVTPTAQPSYSGGTIGISDSVLSDIFDRVNPGVVSIFISSDQGQASGSGFVYDTEGHIITNFHVVDGANYIEVDFPSGLKAEGTILSTDLDSDIAVIKVNVPADQLVPIPLGDSDALKVGQLVVAIGNPFSTFSSTMTMGIVSAKGRILDSIRTDADQNSFTAGDIIQTDATINPGNSGGPLLNLNGEVIGINRAIQTSGTTSDGSPVNSGIGFAVSINIVKRVLPTLLLGEKYDYPYIGISSSPYDFTLAEYRALDISQTSGCYITSVTAGGPAEQAGLQGGTNPTEIPNLFSGGDLIIAVDGKSIISYGDLISYVFTHKSPGDQITLSIIRDGKQMEVPLTLGKRP